jgi:hypothetical protein
MASDPEAAPAAVGENVTVKVTLSFGESVIGKVRPLMEKPVPLRLAAEMVAAALPVLVNVFVRL